MIDARSLVFETIRQRLDTVRGPGLTMVAVDGVDGAGKTRFADDLAQQLEADGVTVVRTGIDHFHNPRAIRYARGKDSPEGFYRDSFDLAALREKLLFPARIDLPFRVAAFDHRTDRPVSSNPLKVPLPAILIFDGLFLHRKELRDEWDLTIFLDVPFAVSYARMAKRDGSDPDPHAPANRRYLEGQQLYFRDANPQRQADILIDYADTDQPRVVRS
ncbi:MAG: uridine kinase [Hyphomicrobiales bacterium]|nr:MAG: uridine kinase [Hyphomicrobiales bacterium]